MKQVYDRQVACSRQPGSAPAGRMEVAEVEVEVKVKAEAEGVCLAGIVSAVVLLAKGAGQLLMAGVCMSGYKKPPENGRPLFCSTLLQ